MQNENDFSRAGQNSLNKDGTQNQPGANSSETPASSTKPLNGAQVASLINIMNQFNSGILTKPQALLLIMSMGFDEATASKILEENKNG